MTESIKEIIRVLQLTSPTEEEGASANSAGGQQLPGGILPGTLAAKVFEAKSLLLKTGMYILYGVSDGLDLCTLYFTPHASPPPRQGRSSEQGGAVGSAECAQGR